METKDDRPICYPDQNPLKENCMPDENRIDPTAAPTQEKAVSPTGEPLIPPKYNKYVVAGFAALGGVAALPFAGIMVLPAAVTTTAMILCLVLGPVFGVSSAGIRKPPTQ